MAHKLAHTDRTRLYTAQQMQSHMEVAYIGVLVELLLLMTDGHLAPNRSVAQMVADVELPTGVDFLDGFNWLCGGCGSLIWGPPFETKSMQEAVALTTLAHRPDGPPLLCATCSEKLRLEGTLKGYTTDPNHHVEFYCEYYLTVAQALYLVYVTDLADVSASERSRYANFKTKVDQAFAARGESPDPKAIVDLFGGEAALIPRIKRLGFKKVLNELLDGKG